MNFVLFSDSVVYEDGRVLKSIDLATRDVSPFKGTCIKETRIPNCITAFWSTLTHCYHASQGVLKKFDLRNSRTREVKPRAFLLDDHSTRIVMCEHHHCLYGARNNGVYRIEHGLFRELKTFCSSITCMMSIGEFLVVGVEKTIYYLRVSNSDVGEWTPLITVEDRVQQLYGTPDTIYMRINDGLARLKVQHDNGLHLLASHVFKLPDISSIHVREINGHPTVYYSVGKYIRIFIEP
jgi:hypothetical protein